MKKLYTILILSIISMGNAIYLTLYALKYRAGYVDNFICDISNTLSCSNLFNFDFSWIFDIPFSAIAMVVYPIIALIAILGILGKCKKTFTIILGLGIGGMMFNSYIIYNEFQVGIFCLACLICSVTITTIAILSAIGLNKKNNS